MCGSMVDIHSATAEIRRGEKRRKKEGNRTKYNVRPVKQGGHYIFHIIFSLSLYFCPVSFFLSSFCHCHNTAITRYLHSEQLSIEKLSNQQTVTVNHKKPRQRHCFLFIQRLQNKGTLTQIIYCRPILLEVPYIVRMPSRA